MRRYGSSAVQESAGSPEYEGRGSIEGRGAVDPRDRVLDPEDLAKRFTREHIRGIGQAVREFVHNYKDLGKPWYEAGVPSAGNGTAMRAAPVGLVRLGAAFRIYRDSLLQSVVPRHIIRFHDLWRLRNRV